MIYENKDDFIGMRWFVYENRRFLPLIEEMPRKIIEMRWIEPTSKDKQPTLSQLGKVLGLSNERVRQLENRGLTHLNGKKHQFEEEEKQIKMLIPCELWDKVQEKLKDKPITLHDYLAQCVRKDLDNDKGSN